MTQDNTYHQPKLFINGREILAKISGTLTFSGANSLNKLAVRINNDELQNDSLYNKPVEFYLNNGSEDSAPMFRGYINNFNPSDKAISLSATDVRSRITGNTGLKVTLTDDNNYDGYTLGQFLFSYISEYFDSDDLSTDFLTDTNPKVFMTGERGDNLDVYQLVTTKIDEAINTDDYLNPLKHYVDIHEGTAQSSMVIRQEKSLTSDPQMYLSFEDGMSSYTYKRRLPPNTILYKNRKFSYTNTPTGQINTQVTEQDSPAETRELALRNILVEQQYTDEITVQVTKGMDIGLGSLVFLDVDREDIKGPHRVQSKVITFGDSCTCKLQLNKHAPVLRDYI